ncbi:MAG: hypothetical protein ACLFTH_01125 [Candidatus Woesearchaeota archaeon]
MVDLQDMASEKFEENLRNTAFSSLDEYKKQQKEQQKQAEQQRQRNLDMQQRQAQQQQQEQQRQAQQQDDKQQIEQGKEQIEQDKENKIQRLVQKRDEKIDRIESGPHGTLAFFTSGLGVVIFWLVAILDAIVNLASGMAGFIPFLGGALSVGLDGLEFFVCIGLIVFYAIPTIFFLGDISAFVKIVLFYLFDAVASFIPVVGDFIDAGFEFVVGVGIKNFLPPHVIKQSYEDRKEDLKAKVRSRYNKKIASVNDDARERIKRLVNGVKKKKLKVNFLGSGDVYYLILLTITFFIGPLGAGWISADFKGITFGVIIVYGFLLAFFYKLNAMGERKIFSVIGFMVIMFLADVFLTSPTLAGSLFGNSTFMVYLVLAFVVVIDIVWAYDPEKLSSFVFFFALVIALIYVAPQLLAYVQSGEVSSDLDANQADIEAGMKNLNPIESFLDTIQRQYGYGNASTVKGGENEKTEEYLGAKIEGVTPLRDYFFTGQEVALDIDTVANSFHPIGLMTMCRVDNKVADEVSPRYTEVTGSKAARIRCSFDSLPKGSHVVDVEQTFRYRSSVKIPLKVMTGEKERTMHTLAKDAGDDYSPSEFIGGGDKAISSSGPIQIRVGNMKKENEHVLEMPIVVDAENPNDHRRVNFKFQLDNTGNTESSKISSINKAVIDMPSGVGLKNCDFMNTRGELPYEDKGERWHYEFDQEFSTWDVFDTISCDLNFYPKIIDDRFEDDGWFFDKIFFTLDYNYKIEKATTVQVEA